MFHEDINVGMNDLHVILSAGSVIDGGFVVRSSADGFHLSGDGSIYGMETNLVAGSKGKGVYIQSGADVTVDGVQFTYDGGDTGQIRGIEVENGSSVVTVDGSTFTGWLTGIYVNGGNELTVSNSFFSAGQVGIGTDGPAKLSVKSSSFETTSEAIGLTQEKMIRNLDISGNTYGETPISIANHGIDTGVDELQGTNVIVVANGQAIQNAVNKLANVLTEGVGQVILGKGNFTGDVALNGNIQLIGQGEDFSKVVGSIKINVPSDAGKVVENVLLSAFTVDPDGAGSFPIIAYSNMDEIYNTDGLSIIGVKIMADGQHGLGLFDVRNAYLQDLIIFWEGDSQPTGKFGIEAIGLQGATLKNISMQGFSTDGTFEMLNIWLHDGYESNGNIQIIGVNNLLDQILYPSPG